MIDQYHPILCLWKQRSLFIGRLREPLDISTGASTLLMGLTENIEIKTEEMAEPLICRSILVPAGTPIVINTNNAFFANITLNPMGSDFQILSNSMEKQSGDLYYQIHNEAEMIKHMLSMCVTPIDHKTIFKFLENLLMTHSIFNHADIRIEHVIHEIQNTIDDNLSLTHLAKTVNLSPAYLTELFKKHTGLPIRRYRLWYRIYMTVTSIIQGNSLTNAAMVSGFSDSSHFNRTFKSMLGMNPTAIFCQTPTLRIIPDVIESMPPTFSSLLEPS